ncbi:MAG: aminotransferase [Micavibrio sp.]|nr:MAG: aminotransferase [Micavibrio sp.]
MTLKTSRRSDIPMFRALDILRDANERAAKGEDIKRLEAGLPCFGVPQAVLDYAKEVIDRDPRQTYTEALGIALVRDRIALYYRDHYGVDFHYSRVAITAGSSGGLSMAFLSAFDVGDKVGICTPTYPPYRNMINSLNLQVVEIQTTAETNYQPTVNLIEQCGEKLDGLVICSPSNPSGTMLSESELEKICNWCEANNVRLISDEAYHNITYEEPAQTAAKFNKDAIVLNTFSKYFAMTGWRLGWMVVPEELTDRIKRLSENYFVSPPTISQHLAYKVFDHMDVLDTYVAYYKKNLDIIKSELPKAGFDKLSNAKGAFYVYADVGHMTNDCEEFCHRIISEAGVAMTPGLDFDMIRGHTSVRICYADDTDDIIEACRRLQEWQK